MTIEAAYIKVSQFNPAEAAVDALESTARQFIAENNAQMYEGLNRKGETIGFYKNAAYAAKKNRMNPKPGYGMADLKVTGDFYREMVVSVSNGNVQFGSQVEYAKYVEKNYGEVIYGLGGAFRKDYVQNYLRPAFLSVAKEVTGLKRGV